MHDNFSFIYSCDLEEDFKIKVGTLEGTLLPLSHEHLLTDPLLEFSGRWSSDQCSDMCVEVQVLSGSEPVTLPVRTSYKAFTSRWNWNEWLNVQTRYCDLPVDAMLRFDVFEPFGPQKVCHIGYAFINIFSSDMRLNQGVHDLKLTLPSALRIISTSDISTRHSPLAEQSSSAETAATDTSEMDRLSELTRHHRSGQLRQSDWLDRLTFREIELINEREKRRSSSLYLMIEFARPVCLQREIGVVYFEKDADKDPPVHQNSRLIVVQDFEGGLDNLLELKHHRLARSLRSGVVDRDLKPDAATRDQLTALVAAPPTAHTCRDAGDDMLWKYRFYLSSQSKALSKFLKCVNWDQPAESQQALELMARWAPIEPHQALELLGPSFSHPSVRGYAVHRLQQAPDEELLMYLLQLVQALRYENEQSIFAGIVGVSPVQWRKFPLSASSNNTPPHSPDDSPPVTTPLLTPFQVSGTPHMSRSPSPRPQSDVTQSPLLSSRRFTIPQSSSTSALTSLSCVAPPDTAGLSPLAPSHLSPNDVQSCQLDLATFLIDRACCNSVVANYLYWFLLIECEEVDDTVKQDIRVRKIYLAVMKRFSMTLSKGGILCQAKRDLLSRQHVFIDKLVKLFRTVCKESGNRRKKIEKMQSLLADRDAFKFDFVSFEPMPLPLDPSIEICGVVPEKTTLFKSALMPARLAFRTVSGAEYVAIFKYGDDLRQDQLVLQIIMLMDKLLRRENLDLKLTPYKVLATSCKHGFVQYVESVSVAELLNQEGSILNYFRRHHPCESAPYGVAPEVMDTYIRSCAGYCVITYLLGVGDRHLDNLLLTPAGNLFHVDFGYILGRDPKPLPPPMKLSKEMVEAMGGINSEHYHMFRKQCYTAFLHLRGHASVILHLFSLMVDANIPDIALEPDKTVRKVQDKFRLDLSDEEAVAYMQTMIDVSVTAVMAALVEQLHKFAQYWRK